MKKDESKKPSGFHCHSPIKIGKISLYAFDL